jgi:hypothetical protein
VGGRRMIKGRFCGKCGQKLPADNLLNKLIGSGKVYKFKDGDYCELCAKAKVKEARK